MLSNEGVLPAYFLNRGETTRAMILRNTTNKSGRTGCGGELGGGGLLFFCPNPVYNSAIQFILDEAQGFKSNPQKPSALFVFKKKELKVYHMSVDTWKEGGIDATRKSFLTLTVEDDAKTTADSTDMKMQH